MYILFITIKCINPLVNYQKPVASYIQKLIAVSQTTGLISDSYLLSYIPLFIIKPLDNYMRPVASYIHQYLSHTTGLLSMASGFMHTAIHHKTTGQLSEASGFIYILFITSKHIKTLVDYQGPVASCNTIYHRPLVYYQR